ncbi:MAG: SDR family NAD(P)-dependent oxidoreductase, partial [Methyloceanibacter sp.]
EGAHVILNGRTASRVADAVQKLKSSGCRGKVDGFAVDLGSSDGVNQVTAKFPDVEILINNLGIFEPKPFEQIPDADWFRFFEVNVLSGVRLSRFYLPRMKERGWGRIVFISSESALQIPKEMIHYGLTKTAQLALSRGLAETTSGTGVTVNAVLPGPTRSDGVEDFLVKLAKEAGQSPDEFAKGFVKTLRPSSLLERFATVEEVANMVVYAASKEASATNGAALRVDGGVVRSIA